MPEQNIDEQRKLWLALSYLQEEISGISGYMHTDNPVIRQRIYQKVSETKRKIKTMLRLLAASVDMNIVNNLLSIESMNDTKANEIKSHLGDIGSNSNSIRFEFLPGTATSLKKVTEKCDAIIASAMTIKTLAEAIPQSWAFTITDNTTLSVFEKMILEKLVKYVSEIPAGYEETPHSLHTMLQTIINHTVHNEGGSVSFFSEWVCAEDIVRIKTQSGIEVAKAEWRVVS